jgi:anthranilate synthase/aminodeoxychorismate synthase-like glutamine amidotransferase
MILLIDNYDSFIFNLQRYLVELGQDVVVFRNDAITLDAIEQANYKAIVISPGPCSPIEAGLSNAVIEQFSGRIPIFGVCLGHQCIGHVFGGKIVRATAPIHGKTSMITIDQLRDNLIFKGLPTSFQVMRYHSLVIEAEVLPDVLAVTAWLPDDMKSLGESRRIIMAVQHKIHPIYGVQFHPESVMSEYGHAMLQNFLDATAHFWQSKREHCV